MMRRFLLLLGGLLSLLLTLLLVAYLAFPQLVVWLAPVVVSDPSIRVLELSVERPGARSIRISHLHVETDALILTGKGLDLGYQWRRLLDTQFDSIEAEQLAIEIREADRGMQAGPGASERSAASGFDLPDPGRLFSQLPVDQVRVADLVLRVPEMAFVASGRLNLNRQRLQSMLEASAPDTARGIVANLQLDRAGEVHAILSRSEAPDRPFLSLQSEVPDDRLQLNAEIHLDGFMLNLLQSLLDLPRGNGSVQTMLSVEYPWPLGADVEMEKLEVRGRASVEWVSEDGKFGLAGLNGSLNLSQGQFEWIFEPSQRGENPEDSAGGALINWRSNGVSAALNPSRISVSLPEERLTAEGTVDLVVDLLVDTVVDGADAVPQSEAAFTGEALLSVEQDGAELGIEASLDGLLNAWDRNFPLALGFNARLTDVLAARLLVTSGIVRQLEMNVSYGLEDGTLELAAAHELEFSKPLLASLWPGWSEPFDFEEGKIGLKLNLAGADPTALSGSLVLEQHGVAAVYENTAIRGMDGVLKARIEQGQLTVLPSRIEIALLDFGVPVSNITTHLAGDLQRLTIGETSGRLLDGRFLVEPFNYSADSGQAELTLQLEGLDLAAVLALEGGDVTGTGRLDGEIPVSIRGDHITVNGGEVHAREPGGTIRLSSKVASSLAQPGLDLALGALTNFRYRVLTAQADYGANGDLQLGIRLQGSNQDVEKGRPIHFNLNISENIPVLLESLRMQDAFTGRIEQKVLR